MAHVHEMKAEVDKGLKFMASTEKDWMVSLKNISVYSIQHECETSAAVISFFPMQH